MLSFGSYVEHNSNWKITEGEEIGRKTRAGILNRYLFLSKCLSIRHALLATRLVEDAACLSICLRISSD